MFRDLGEASCVNGMVMLGRASLVAVRVYKVGSEDFMSKMDSDRLEFTFLKRTFDVLDGLGFNT